MEYFMHCFSVYNENKKGTFFFLTYFRSLWLLQNARNIATPLCLFFFLIKNCYANLLLELICFQITKSINRFLNPGLY